MYFWKERCTPTAFVSFFFFFGSATYILKSNFDIVCLIASTKYFICLYIFGKYMSVFTLSLFTVLGCRTGFEKEIPEPVINSVNIDVEEDIISNSQPFIIKEYRVTNARNATPNNS